MAAFPAPSARSFPGAVPAARSIARLRTWRATRRRSWTDFLALGAATFGAFVILLLGIEQLSGSDLVERVFAGRLSARFRADYSATVETRIKPVRAVVTNATRP